MTSDQPRTVVAFVPDLMDRSRLGGCGVSIEFAQSTDALVARSVEPGGSDELVLVDLDRPGVMEAVRAIHQSKPGRPPIVVGFSHHAQNENHAVAEEAGCRVVTRAAFFRSPCTYLVGSSSSPDLPDTL
jgi:CheY-like chemotaxis protein